MTCRVVAALLRPRPICPTAIPARPTSRALLSDLPRTRKPRSHRPKLSWHKSLPHSVVTISWRDDKTHLSPLFRPISLPSSLSNYSVSSSHNIVIVPFYSIIYLFSFSREIKTVLCSHFSFHFMKSHFLRIFILFQWFFAKPTLYSTKCIWFTCSLLGNGNFGWNWSHFSPKLIAHFCKTYENRL